MEIVQTNILGLPTDIFTLKPDKCVLSWEAYSERQQNDEPGLEPERCDQWDYG